MNYRFLSNQPIGEDKFEGQSQEKIAEVLVEILNDSQFQIIGIDGSWGTGKSNLVEIVKRKLSSHNFFIYDVWGHQEDEQRRAILLELTESLSKYNIIKNKNSWDEKLQMLLSKRKSTTTVNQPYLGIGFILSLLAIIYVPLVNVFVDKGGYNNIKTDWWRVGLVGLPICLILGILLFKIFYQLLVKKCGCKSFKIAAQQTFQVYNNRQEQETKIETISESEPSVREFRDWLREIDADLTGKKLVLVLDNLDRLPQKHILSIWSSLHVFFSEEKYNNIKVIVPFDREHISNAFRDMNGEDGDYSSDYVNKTFDIVYRVAPPIMSDWKAYFKSCFEYAFGNLQMEEYVRVEQAFEFLNSKFTPREIITFINELVMMKQIHESVPFRYIAIYVLKKLHINSNPLRSVLDLSYLKGIEYVYIEDIDFQKYVTALAYQIKPENSLEVVYSSELKISLINRDEKKFHEISRTNLFNVILPALIVEIDNLESAILMLASLPNDALIKQEELDSLWNDLYLLQQKRESKSPVLKDYHLFLLGKLKSSSQQSWFNLIIQNLYVDQAYFDALVFVKQIDDIIEYCLSNGLDLDVNANLLKTNIGIVQFKQLIGVKKQDFRKYKLDCPKENVEEYLSTLSFENIFEADFVHYLDFNHELSGFHELVKGFVRGREYDVVHMRILFDFLLVTTGRIIDNPLNDEQISSLINRAEIDDPFLVDLACMRIKLANESNPNYSEIYNKVLCVSDLSFLQLVARKLNRYVSLEEFLLSSVYLQYNLVRGVLPIILQECTGNEGLDVRKIIPKLIDLRNSNSLDPEEVLIALDKFPEVFFDFDSVYNLDPDELIQLLFKSQSEIGERLISILSDEFSSLDQGKWNEIFNSLNSRELQILLMIDFQNWNAFALEAFGKRLKGMAYENAVADIDNIAIITKRLEFSGFNLKNTYKNLRDELILTNRMTVLQFRKLISLLLKYGALEEKATDVLRTIFKSEFLDDSECLSLIKLCSVDLKRILDKCEPLEKSDFVNALIARVENTEVSELCKALEIEVGNIQEGEVND